jgi:hypothetical protein
MESKSSPIYYGLVFFGNYICTGKNVRRHGWMQETIQEAGVSVGDFKARTLLDEEMP